MNTQITEDYVSFETAKLLKEKEFDENINTYRDDFIQRGSIVITLRECLSKDKVKTPTLQMAMKWLRKVHNLDITALPQFDNSKWTYSAIIFKLSIPCTEIRLNDNKDKKEQACEATIKYCLTNLI